MTPTCNTAAGAADNITALYLKTVRVDQHQHKALAAAQAVQAKAYCELYTAVHGWTNGDELSCCVSVPVAAKVCSADLASLQPALVYGSLLA